MWSLLRHFSGFVLLGRSRCNGPASGARRTDGTLVRLPDRNEYEVATLRGPARHGGTTRVMHRLPASPFSMPRVAIRRCKMHPGTPPPRPAGDCCDGHGRSPGGCGNTVIKPLAGCTQQLPHASRQAFPVRGVSTKLASGRTRVSTAVRRRVRASSCQPSEPEPFVPDHRCRCQCARWQSQTRCSPCYQHACPGQPCMAAARCGPFRQKC